MNDPVQAVDVPPIPAPEQREAAVYRRLSGLGIAWVTHAHAPVFTVEEAQSLRGSLPGLHTKICLSRTGRAAFGSWLRGEELAVDLNSLARSISAPRFSFGKAADMVRLLGIEPGAVNPFAVMNDRDGCVTVLLDRALAGGGMVNFHPMRNDRTTAIAAGDLIRFMAACGHEPVVVEMPERVAR